MGEIIRARRFEIDIALKVSFRIGVQIDGKFCFHVDVVMNSPYPHAKSRMLPDWTTR